MWKTVNNGKQTRLYRVWATMKNRCYLRTSEDFKNYGGRGITVCSEWLKSYATFRAWALSSGYRKGLSIERLDNDKGYCERNCAWVPMAMQPKNTRRTKLLKFNGRVMSLTEWSREVGLPQPTITQRLQRGWPIEAAIGSPSGTRYFKYGEAQ